MRKMTLLAIIFLTAHVAFCAAEQTPPNPSFDYNDARNFNNNGVDLIDQGNHKDAVREFEKALAIDPNFHIARYNLALALYNNGRIDEAIVEFTRLTRESQHFVNAHYNLGTIYLRKGMLDEARKELEAVVEMEPGHSGGHFNLGFIYFRKNMLDEAIKEYQDGLRIKPGAVKGYLSLAFIYEKKEMYKKAIEQYNEVLKLKPDSEEIILAAGSVQAIMNLKEALREDPQDVQSYLYLGHIYYSRGMYEDALKAYNEAARIDPDNPIAKESVQKAVVQNFASRDLLE